MISFWSNNSDLNSELREHFNQKDVQMQNLAIK